MGSASKPYDQRTDLEKIYSQWTKLVGLHDRQEWSASIMRAATAAEIAANLVIRAEFAKRSEFDAEFIDSLLIWANGLRGKMERLVLKFPSEGQRPSELKKLLGLAKDINDLRNKVAHSGSFASRKQARDVESKARKFIEGMVAPYEKDVVLKPLKIKGGADDGEFSS